MNIHTPADAFNTSVTIALISYDCNERNTLRDWAPLFRHSGCTLGARGAFGAAGARYWAVFDRSAVVTV